MKKVFLLVSLALVLGLVLVGCPDSVMPTPDSVTPTPEPEPPFMPMVPIPGGEFARDNDAQDSGTETTKITVSSFYLGETEVTEAQWEAVMGIWPQYDPVTRDNFGSSAEHPARYISWYDAIKFCNQLSLDENLEPVYYKGESYPVTANIKKDTQLQEENGYGFKSPVINANFSKNGYRLSTEAEWEYAAGGGDSDVRTTYAGISEDGNDPVVEDLGDYAWYSENSGNTAHAVKGKKPNDLGLYDMSGNVREWCWDWRVNPYDKSVTDNPKGPDSGSLRVIRGGSWDYASSVDCAACRRSGTPSARSSGLGFRVARSVAP